MCLSVRKAAHSFRDLGGHAGILAEGNAPLPHVGVGDVDLQRGHAFLRIEARGQLTEFLHRSGIDIGDDGRFLPGQQRQFAGAKVLHAVVLQAHGIEHAGRGFHNARRGVAGPGHE